MAPVSPQRPEALGPKYPSKAERKAAKRAKQQVAQQQEPTPAELNTSRLARSETAASQRSAALRAEHLMRGHLPIEALTANPFDEQGVYLAPTLGGDETLDRIPEAANLTDMVDHNKPRTVTQLVGPALDPAFVVHMQRHTYERLTKRRVVRQASNPTVWPKLWERAERGERLARIAKGKLLNLGIGEIARYAGCSERTVQRALGVDADGQCEVGEFMRALLSETD